MSDARILKFNVIGGKAPVTQQGSADEFWKSLENQARRVKEEAEELLEAAKNRNFQEVVDGWVDVWFTNEFVEDQLSAIGVNTNRIKTIVCENNLSKFTTNKNYAEDCARLMEEEVEVREVVYEGVPHYALIRLKDSKVMKPLDYRGPKLSDAIPIGVWEFIGGSQGCKEQ